MTPHPHLAFIGGGNMASAIISGLLAHGFNPLHINVVEHNPQTAQHLREQFAIHVQTSLDLTHKPDVWVLAVKPQNMREVLQELTPHLYAEQLLISIAAGLTVATLTQWSNHGKIARTMPNTPALVGQGVTGIYAPRSIFAENEQQFIDQLFKSIGQTVWLNHEAEIDAITAISGSGPAYVFYMMEHLTAAAMQLGFDANTAQTLVKSTFTGAVTLANNSPDSLATLREKVTSKGGTTAAALDAFNQNGLDQAIHAGAQAAATRAAQLAQELAQ
ncbi:MAG: pyrroline-5-carboxylate reductase [Formosimonas sp.]